MTNIMGISVSATSINITWTHPDPITVDAFDVRFAFSILGCPRDDGHANTLLQRSALTPIDDVYHHELKSVEEDSEFTITVAAINYNTGETAGASITVQTLLAGV